MNEQISLEVLKRLSRLYWKIDDDIVKIEFMPTQYHYIEGSGYFWKWKYSAVLRSGKLNPFSSDEQLACIDTRVDIQNLINNAIKGYRDFKDDVGGKKLMKEKEEIQKAADEVFQGLDIGNAIKPEDVSFWTKLRIKVWS